MDGKWYIFCQNNKRLLGVYFCGELPLQKQSKKAEEEAEIKIQLELLKVKHGFGYMILESTNYANGP